MGSRVLNNALMWGLAAVSFFAVFAVFALQVCGPRYGAPRLALFGLDRLFLAGGPLVEATHDRLAFTGPLTAITAAVVGVVANLALFFAGHVLR